MKSKKLLFAFLLALIVCLLLVPSAFADDDLQLVPENEAPQDPPTNPVATVEDVVVKDESDDEHTADISADTLEDAINASQKDATVKSADGSTSYTVTENAEVTLNSSVNLGTTLTIDTDQYVVINLNGHDINFTNSGNGIVINAGATLELKGSGIVSTIGGSSGTATVYNCGTFILNGATLSSAGNSTPLMNNGGNAQLNSGEIKGEVSILSGSVSISDKVSISKQLSNIGGDLTVTGGDYSSCPINVANYTGSASLTIEDGTFDSSKIQINVVSGGTTLNFTVKGGSFTGSTILTSSYDTAPISNYLAPGYRLVEKDGKFVVEAIPAVVAPVVETVAEYVPAVVETVNNIIAISGNDNNSYSISSNEDFTITLGFSDPSANDQLPEILSVSINGVEVDFRIAQDGTIILSPEVLAALGPGTHVITIMTSNGPVTMTIVITD